MPEFNDYWLWIVDDQYVHSPLSADVLEQADSKRSVELPALARALILNTEGKTANALQEVEAAVDSGEDAPELLWAKGQLEFELGHYEESLEAFERVLEAWPDNKGARFNCGFCLERLGRFDEAADCFRMAVDADPNFIVARLALGQCLFRLDQPDAALQEFNACLEIDPDNERALAAKAAALHVLGNYEEAFTLYRKVSEKHPEEPELFGNLVAVCAARRDEPRLREYAEALIKQNPASRLALQGLVTAALLRGNYDVASYYGAQYVKAAPDSYEGWFNLGFAHHKTGAVQEAIEAYRHAAGLRPERCEALSNLGALLHEHDDAVQARKTYERVLELDPKSPATLWNLGLLYEHEANHDQAETCYSRLVELQPERDEGWLRLGYLRLQHDDVPGAIEALEEIATRPQARSDALVNLAIAYWRSHRLAEAKALMASATKDHPNTIEFLRVLAVVAVDEGNCNDAAALEVKLDQLGEHMPELSYNVGVLLENAGRHDAAVQAFQRAVRSRADFGEALLNLGHAFQALGDTEKANAYWRDAVSLMPELAGNYFGGQ